jgi:hypothetical protein
MMRLRCEPGVFKVFAASGHGYSVEHGRVVILPMRDGLALLLKHPDVFEFVSRITLH